VVLPTANLVDYDWRDIENTVFVQDLPLIPDPASHDPQSHDFPTYLWGVLKSLNVPAGLLNLVNTGYHELPVQSLEDLQSKWDWSKVRAKLVASIAGNYDGWYNVRMYGHPRLAAVIRDIGAQPTKGKILNIECQVYRACNHQMAKLIDGVGFFGGQLHNAISQRGLQVLLRNGSDLVDRHTQGAAGEASVAASQSALPNTDNCR